MTPSVDIITVTYGNMFPVLKRTVDSLYRYTAQPFRLIIVNNGSTDETLTAFNELPGCTLINLKENAGMVKAFNIGLKASTAPYIARMDHDVEFVMPWEDELLGLLERDNEAGAVGPRIITPDGRIYAALFSFFVKVPGIPLKLRVESPFAFPLALRRFVHFTQHSLEADDDLKFGVVKPVYHVTGTFFVMKRAAFEKVGAADESYPDKNGAYEDLDYTLRMATSGLKVMYDGRVKLVHHCSRPDNSVRETAPALNREKFKNKWGFL